MSKVSWLDSANMQSGIHVVNGNENVTLCGYPFETMFRDGVWKPFKVGGHATHRCKKCYSIAIEQGIDFKQWDIRIPERKN